MSQEIKPTTSVEPQIIIDEMLKKINALTAENIILSSQVRSLSDKLSGYLNVSPSSVMTGTVDSEGKYEDEINAGKFGMPEVQK